MTKDSTHEQFFKRIRELEASGSEHHEAFEIAKLESNIQQWPSGWGDDLQVALYGAIEIERDFTHPGLGISISSQRESGNFAFKAPWAYTARIKIPSKDIAGVLDGIRRLEKFLGAWHAISWGRTIQYFCFFFSESADTSTSLEKESEGISRFVETLNSYPHHVQRLIERASWWMRQSKRSLLSGESNPSSFFMYSSYWNALECLTEAVCEINPPAKISPKQKNDAIKEFLLKLKHSPTAEDIENCYRQYVDPGIRQSISHALRVCFRAIGDQYIEECFQRQPKELRLYQIRNDINHANIVEYDFNARLRVETGLYRLSMLVLNILFILTRQPIMLDSQVRSCYTCKHFLWEDRTCQLDALPNSERYWRYVCNNYQREQKPR